MIWGLFVKKLIKVGVQAFLAVLGAENVQAWGIMADASVGTVTISLYTLIEALRQYLKHNVGVSFL